MQNWNQWQLPAAPVTAPMPQPPIGYAAPGADPMATMQSYLQYYNQPAPSGYTTEQWAAAQQQNWAQWQTWQQQYRQWQAQYGEKYQETMKQMSSQGLPSVAQVPAASSNQPPPLPKEDASAKPPLPPDSNAFGFSGIPPPHQNNLPLFPSRQSANPPLPPSQPPLPPASSRNVTVDNNPSGKRVATSDVESVSAKKLKVEDDELTEAEKTFDAQFKQWEEQFNKWKQQNANHPDKTQYKQYEAKWTSWREKLIERREQMRRKREQQKQAAAKAEAEKEKSLVGDDKILNILSSTENQGLINNLLGIGKTLGLTGKNEVSQTQTQVPIVQPPAALPATAMGAPTMTPNMNQAAWAAQQWAAQYNAGLNMTNYTAGYQQQPSISQPSATALTTPMPVTNFNQPPSNFNQPPANFNQPPPGILGSGQNFSNPPNNMSTGGPNFSLPPPGFGGSNAQQQIDSSQGQRTAPRNLPESNTQSFRDSSGRDSMGSGNDRYNFDGNRFSGPPPNDPTATNRGGQFGLKETYGREGSNKDFVSGNQYGSGSDNIRRDDSGRDFSPGGRSGNEFRSGDRFGNDSDRLGSGFDRDQGGNRSGRDGDKQENRGDNRAGSERDSFKSERFVTHNERFGSNNDRFSSNNERFGPNDDHFGPNKDRFSSGNDQFRSENDRFGSSTDRLRSGNDQFGSASGDRFGGSSDRFGASNDRFGTFNDRFGPSNDRFGASNDRFGASNDRQSMSGMSQSNDKFSRPPPDRFESRDGSRDSGGANSRGFGKNNQFERPADIPPELQKLMEKRKAAMDVFKPSNFSSLLDSNKICGAETSLSESFRRITGDSPFLSRGSVDFRSKDNNLGSKGPLIGASGSSGSGNFEPCHDVRSNDSASFKFRGSGDFKPQGSGDLRSRGAGDFGSRSNEFGPRDSEDFGSRGGQCGSRESGDFGPRVSEFGSRGIGATGGGPRRLGDLEERRGNEFGPRSGQNFDSSSRNDQKQQRDSFGNEIGPRSGEDFESPTRNEQRQQRESVEPSDKRTSTPENSERMLKSPVQQEPPMDTVDKRKDVEESFDERSPNKVKTNNNSDQQPLPPLQMPLWMGTDFTEDDIIEIPVIKSIEKTNLELTDPANDNSEPPRNNELSRADPEESENPSIDAAKNSDVLPFMGENDPKPEDLNMEPPPELPNLGPVVKNPEPQSEASATNMSDPFSRPSGNLDRQMNFDASFGSPSVQTKARGPMPFGPRGPNDSRLPPFGPRDTIGGPSENTGPGSGPFGSHCASDGLSYGSRDSPVDSFKPGGPIGPFGPRGTGDFGSRGPGNFGPRDPTGFGPRGPGDFGPRGPPNFGPRGPFDFRPRGPGDFGPRGPLPGFGPRGPSDFGPRGPFEFGSRDANDRPFGPCGISPFGPRPQLDRTFGPSTSNDPPFGTKPPFGSNTFAPRGNPDNPATGIPSLMSFKFNRPIDSADEIPTQMSNDFDGNQCNDLPPAFRKSDQDQRPFSGGESREDRGTMDQGPGPNILGPRGPSGTDWRDPFVRNKFGDSDQRSAPPNFVDSSPMRSGNQVQIDRDKLLPGPAGEQEKSERLQSADKNIKSKGSMIGPCFDESSGGLNDKDRTGGSNFIMRRSDERTGNDVQKEFCVEKQFNYNHSGGMPDEISKEHSPTNVIDYAHVPRVIVHDYVTPAQCYEYGHGNLKPIVPDHEVYSKKDFKNWVENEQNLREYMDRMRTYESDMRALKRGSNQRQPEPPLPFKERHRIQDDRRSFDHDRRSASNRSDRGRRDRDTDDYRDTDRKRESRERGRIERDREWERASNKPREDRSQHRRSKSKERTRERPEKIRKETNKENKKDDERSKGNVAGPESLAKKPAESTTPDNSKQEIKDGESEATSKITEVAEIVEMQQTMELPMTMELPKTPNFTMVDDLLCQPGRQNRPPKIVVILRGPPGSGKSFVAKLIKDKEVEQGGSAPRILSLDDYFLTEKEIETEDDNGKKITTKEMAYEYEEAMEPSYITSLIKAFKKNITNGFFNFIILDSINEKISDYEEMWSFAKTKGFRVYVCEMEMDVQICLKRNIHKRTEDEVNRIVDYFEPTPGYHQKLDVTTMLQEEAIEEVHMEDSQEVEEEPTPTNDDSQDSQEDPQDSVGVSKWERMEAEDKLDRLDGLAKRKNEGKPQTMEDFLQVPDYYNMVDTSGKRRVRWADLEERKEQEKMRAVGFVVGQTNWNRMMDPTKGSSALTRTKYI